MDQVLRLILFSLSSLLFCSIAWANDLFIYYNSNDTGAEYSRLKSHYESLGFTVTGSTSTTVSSSDVSGQELVIDIAGTSNCGSTCRSVYDSYVSGGGKLIIAAPAGASNRQSNIESLIENKMSVGTITYYTGTCSTDLCWQNYKKSDYSTSGVTDYLPGAGQLFTATGGTAMAINGPGSSYNTWYKWDYGSNGGSIIVAMGYDQFQTNLTYTSSMTAFLTAVVEEEGLYTSSSSGSSATPSYSSGATSAQQTRINSHTSNVNSGGANDITVDIDGDDNNVYITQTGEPSYLLLNVTGNLNDVDIDQNASTATTYGHYLEADIIGNSNILDITQTGSGQKSAFINYEGNSNDATIIQKDGGSHYLMLDLIGDGNDATITQEGSGSHEATVELTENGGAWTFMLNQSGTTDKTYSLPHSMSDGSTISGTCSTSAGCSLTVNQGD